MNDPFDLDRSRRIGDPEADHVAAALADATDGPLLARIGSMFADPSSAPPEFAAWFDLDGLRLPDWADPDLIEAGQDVFRTWVLQIAGTLFSAALPFDYAAAKGVEVLAHVSQLSEGREVSRRLAETGQVLVQLHDLGNTEDRSFTPGSRSLVSLRSIRLAHAAVRVDLLAEPGWDVEGLGIPINQEDMLGTLLSFTTVTIEGLRRLGTALNDAEIDGYLHLWSVAGWLLGMEETHLPLTRESGPVLQAQIEARQHRPSRSGQLLMTALLNELESSTPWGLRKVPRTLIREAVGDTIADIVGVPAAAWWAPALGPLAALSRLAGRVPAIDRLASLPSRAMGAMIIRRYIDEGLAGRRPRFEISDEQRAQWRLGHGRIRRAIRERRLTRRAGPAC